MSKKQKFVNKYENYQERSGTINTLPSITNKEYAEDTNIYYCIEKYGIDALMRKTTATDYFYDEYDNQPKTLMDRVKQRENLNEYFKNLPARVRKQFGDSPEIFYEKFKKGDFDTMLDKGILSEELSKRYSETIKDMEKKTNDEIQEHNDNSKDISSDPSKSSN